MSKAFIFELLSSGTIQFVNAAVAELTGYAPEELIGQDWFLTLFPHQDPERLEAWRAQMLAEDTFQLEGSIRGKDGSLGVFEVNTAVQRDQHGAVERITGFAIKNSPFEPAQKVERRSEVEYRALFENSLSTILVANDAAEFIEVNAAACALLGYSREELLSMRVPDLFAEADGDQIADLRRSFMEEGEQRGELRLLRKDGSWIDVEYFAKANVSQGTHVAIMHDISKRKRAGFELAESEQRYRTLFETMAQGVAYVNRDGIITVANPAASQIFGLPQDELVGRSAWDASWGAIREDRTDFPPEEYPSRVAMRSGEEVKDVIMGVFNPEDEEHRWIRIRALPQFRAAEEEACQVYLTFEDITGKVLAERALRESEERYRLLVELSPDAIGIQSNGRILFVNEAGARILGAKSPEQLIGRCYQDFLHPDDLTASLYRQRRLDQNRPLQPSEVKITRLDGRVITIESTAKQIMYEGEPAILFISRDVTERVVAEIALRAGEERYRNLFESAPVSLWEDDFSGMKAYLEGLIKDGVQDLRAHFDSHPEAIFECINQAKVLDVNRATVKLYEAGSKGDLLGPIEPVLDKESWRTYLEAILSIAEGRTTFEIETVNRTLRGKEIDIILSWSVAPGSEESYDTVMVSIVDISERKRIERSEREQRALAEALRDISATLSGTLNYEEVLDRILEDIARVADFDTAHILLVENGAARMVRWRGYDRIPTGPVDVGPLTFRIEEVGNLRQMAESGLPLVIPDIREFAGWIDIPELRFIRSFAGAPIRVRGGVVGFLNITSQKPGFFTAAYAPRLQALADQTAIALENSRLYEQVIAGRERMRLLSQQLVSAHEEERHRLSRELHDEAGQALTALQIGLRLVHDEISPDQADLRRQVKGSIGLAEATMDRMRFLAQNLRPPALDAIGLVPTLKDLSEEYALRSGLALSFYSDAIPDLSDEVNVCLYRVLQEALTNVVKHAAAKNIVVALRHDDGEVTLGVGDDGRGFDPHATRAPAEKVDGLGLLGMQERLELVGGMLELKTAPGTGTTLTARVPSQADHLERRQPHDPRRNRR